MGKHFERGHVDIDPKTGQYRSVPPDEYKPEEGVTMSKKGGRATQDHAPHMVTSGAGYEFDPNFPERVTPAANERAGRYFSSGPRSSGYEPTLKAGSVPVREIPQEQGQKKEFVPERKSDSSKRELVGSSVAEYNNVEHDSRQATPETVQPETVDEVAERNAEFDRVAKEMERDAKDLTHDLQRLEANGKALEPEERQQLAERIMAFVVDGHGPLTALRHKYGSEGEALEDFIARNGDLEKQFKRVTELGYAVRVLREQKTIPVGFTARGEQLLRGVNDSILELGHAAAEKFPELKSRGSELANTIRRFKIFVAEKE